MGFYIVKLCNSQIAPERIPKNFYLIKRQWADLSEISATCIIIIITEVDLFTRAKQTGHFMTKYLTRQEFWPGELVKL
jgi:hypothetical protein